MGGAAFAAGSNYTKTIDVSYMGIKLVVDGIEVTPKDVNGVVVDPFVSEGTTYLPIRALGEALGKKVTWEGDTKTIYIGEVPGQKEDWMDKLPPYQVDGDKMRTMNSQLVFDGSDPKAYYTVGGVKHTEGVALIAGWGTLSNDAHRSYALWNTNCQYNSMTIHIGHIDGLGSDYAHDATLSVYTDGTLAQEYALQWDGPIQTLTIPLNYCANVKLEITPSQKPTWDYTAFGVFDFEFQECSLPV